MTETQRRNVIAPDDRLLPARSSGARVDPYLWLEEVEGERALAWVRDRNDDCTADLASGSRFAVMRDAIRAVLDAEENIPTVAKAGDLYYNFWRDAEHPRGVWRRTTLDSYRTNSPEWETVLSLDALSAEEGTSWVWHGASVLQPDARRALLKLSPGGSDADVTREFDLVELRFVPPQEGGFVRAQAKGSLDWIDEDTVYVRTDFGPGTTGPSGYPRIVKRWRRPTPMSAAETVFEGDPDDMTVFAAHSRTPGFERDLVRRSRTFYTGDTYLLRDGELVHLDLPESAKVGTHREWLLVELRDDWTFASTTYRAGSFLAVEIETFLAGESRLTVLFEPGPRTSFVHAAFTRHHAVLFTLEDVKSHLQILTPPLAGAGPGTPWRTVPFTGLPSFGTVTGWAVDPDESDDVWLVTTDHLTPSKLSLVTLGPDGPAEPEPLKASPTFFDADPLVSEQRFATSDDGTRVPYFVVGPADLSLDGTTPTLLRGYGGFEVSLTPRYSGTIGRGWLERGGVYVVANIRGGGEYGPAWHQAALKANRHRAYEDFAGARRGGTARGSRATSWPRESRRPSTWAPAAAPTAASLSATCSHSTRSCSAHSRFVCRCWTCAVTRSSLPGRAGSPSTATPKTPTSGSSSGRSRRTTCSTTSVRTHQCCSRAPPWMTASTPDTRARWPRSCSTRPRTSPTTRTSRAGTAAPQITSRPRTWPHLSTNSSGSGWREAGSA